MGYLRVKKPKPDLHSYADWLFLFTKMKNLTQSELFKISDNLYKMVNPKSKMCTPNNVYIIVIEKWYPEYLSLETDLNFFNWCLLNKK